MTGNIRFPLPARFDTVAPAGTEFTPLLRLGGGTVPAPARAWAATQGLLAACAKAFAPASDDDTVRVWFDLDELSRGLVCRDKRPLAAEDAAAWLGRGGWVRDGDAWIGDRADLRLVRQLGVRRVRRA